MPLQAQQICSLARQNAKALNYTSQSGQLLNSVLSDLCQTYDFDLAKAAYNFNLTPGTVSIGNLNAQLASGPFLLPNDYLRAKINDILYFPNGLGNFPLRLTPIDLGEFDGLVQQAGFQNFPVFWVTDVSRTPTSFVGSTHTNTTLDSIASTASMIVGMSIAGSGIAAGTTIATIASSTSITLSAAATSSVTGGTFTFAPPPLAYVWPPASGTYPVMVRYYRQMADIDTPETSTAIPWFPNQEYLRKKVTAGLMEITGDDRQVTFLTEAEDVLTKYLRMKDDSTNRSQRVHLDPRRFGPAWDRLPKSKTFGY